MTTGATFSFIAFTLSQIAKYAGTKVAIPRFDVFDQADGSDKPFTENREVAPRLFNVPKFNVGGGFGFVFRYPFKMFLDFARVLNTMEGAVIFVKNAPFALLTSATGYAFYVVCSVLVNLANNRLFVSSQTQQFAHWLPHSNFSKMDTGSALVGELGAIDPFAKIPFNEPEATRHAFRTGNPNIVVNASNQELFPVVFRSEIQTTWDRTINVISSGIVQ